LLIAVAIKVEEYFFDPLFVPYQSSQIKIVLELILRAKKKSMARTNESLG
jgi:hypothetical protein